MNKPPVLNKFTVFQRILTFVLIIISTLILVMILGIVIAVPIYGGDIMKDIALMETSTDPNIIALAKYFQIVSQFGIFLIPTVLFAFLDGRNIGYYLKLNINPGLKSIVFAVLAILALVPLINFIGDINQQMNFPPYFKDIETWMRDSEDLALKMTTNFLNVSTIEGLLINVLMIAIIPALGEEFLFRGILQKLFHQWLKNNHFAVILSAFIFSAIHIQFYGFIPRFFLGIFLGYTFIWSGSLWMPIVIHFVNNFAAVLSSYIMGPDIDSNFLETIGTGESASITITISIVLSTGFIFLIYYFEKKKNIKQVEN